jgi:phage terminase small subunit
MSLSAKHKAFCDEYLSNGLNATQAYKSVYKTNDKVSEASASRLLLNVKVKEYIQKEQNKTSQKLEITREFLIKEYLELIQSAKTDENFIDRGNWNKSLAQLAKLLGLDAAIKQDITITEQPLFLDDEE